MATPTQQDQQKKNVQQIQNPQSNFKNKRPTNEPKQKNSVGDYKMSEDTNTESNTTKEKINVNNPYHEVQMQEDAGVEQNQDIDNAGSSPAHINNNQSSAGQTNN